MIYLVCGPPRSEVYMIYMVEPKRSDGGIQRVKNQQPAKKENNPALRLGTAPRWLENEPHKTTSPKKPLR